MGRAVGRLTFWPVVGALNEGALCCHVQPARPRDRITKTAGKSVSIAGARSIKLPPGQQATPLLPVLGILLCLIQSVKGELLSSERTRLHFINGNRPARRVPKFARRFLLGCLGSKIFEFDNGHSNSMILKISTEFN